MKLFTKIFFACIAAFALFGILLPKLFSTKNDAAMYVGIAVILVVIYYLAQTVITIVQDKFDDYKSNKDDEGSEE